jgi:predicted RNA-binding Zn ribbon-like protein
MKKRASDEVLGALHELVAKELTHRIAGGEATPADLNAAIKFLQNNGIEAIATEESPLGKLVASLPTFDDEDIEARPN